MLQHTVPLALTDRAKFKSKATLDFGKGVEKLGSLMYCW